MRQARIRSRKSEIDKHPPGGRPIRHVTTPLTASFDAWSDNLQDRVRAPETAVEVRIDSADLITDDESGQQEKVALIRGI